MTCDTRAIAVPNADKPSPRSWRAHEQAPTAYAHGDDHPHYVDRAARRGAGAVGPQLLCLRHVLLCPRLPHRSRLDTPDLQPPLDGRIDDGPIHPKPVI